MNNTNIKHINPSKLDIVMQEDGYCLYYDYHPLLINNTRIVADSPKILNYLITELTFNISDDSYKNRLIKSYIDFLVTKDFAAKFNNLKEQIRNDYFLKKKLHQQIDVNESKKIFELYEKEQFALAFIFNSSTSITKAFSIFLKENGFNDFYDDEQNSERLYLFINEYITNLSKIEKFIVLFLNDTYNSGILLPLLLIAKKISPLEFTNSLISIKLLSENDSELNDSTCKELYKKTHYEVLKIKEFVDIIIAADSESDSLFNIINSGESNNLEFKSTLRWNLRDNKKDTAIEHSALKTIAAFLNSNGGTLLLGVKDNGEILGIETDSFENIDKFQLHLWNLIKVSLGQDLNPYINSYFETVENKTVCIVKCLKSKIPVFLNHKGYDEEFYIRVGPGSVKLGLKDTHNYILENF